MPIQININNKIKLPNIILDFNYIFKTYLINKWNIETIVKICNKLNHSRKNKAFKFAFYTEYKHTQ
jgi:hypothetical protein